MRIGLLSAALLLVLSVSAFAQDAEPAEEAPQEVYDAPPAPVTNLIAKDHVYDSGKEIDIEFDRSADDGSGADDVEKYEVYRSESGSEETLVTTIPAMVSGGDRRVIIDDSNGGLENGAEYSYRVLTIDRAGGSSETRLSGTVSPSGEWFDFKKINMLAALVILVFLIKFFIRKAQRGEEIYLRPVAGLQAFDEAVGRATEMGKSVLYVPGIMDLDQVETVAGIIILGYVSKMTARYETDLEVPVSRSLVMSNAREVCKSSYLSEGRPELFKDDMVHYLTDDQFAYAAGVNGIMLRKKPAACFYQGKFYAESLILAETGNSIGAIQIAGTASPAQIPFFITACDYTLIGEEFFAASAYLSQDPKLVGSLKGQDWAKGIIMIAIVVGALVETLNVLGVVTFSLKPLLAVG